MSTTTATLAAPETKNTAELLDRAAACVTNPYWETIFGWVYGTISNATTSGSVSPSLPKALEIAEPILKRAALTDYIDEYRQSFLDRAEALLDSPFWGGLRQDSYRKIVEEVVDGKQLISPWNIEFFEKALDALERVVNMKQLKRLVNAGDNPALRRMGLTGTSSAAPHTKRKGDGAKADKRAADRAFRNSCKGSTAEVPLHPNGKKSRKK